MAKPSLYEILRENSLLLPADAMEVQYLGASGNRLVMINMPDHIFQWDEMVWDNVLFGADIDTFREKLEESLTSRFVRPVSAMNGPLYLERHQLEGFNALHMHLSPMTDPDFMKDSLVFRSGDLTMVSAIKKKGGYFMLNLLQ
jgi:hypothetical protein